MNNNNNIDANNPVQQQIYLKIYKRGQKLFYLKYASHLHQYIF